MSIEQESKESKEPKEPKSWEHEGENQNENKLEQQEQEHAEARPINEESREDVDINEDEEDGEDIEDGKYDSDDDDSDEDDSDDDDIDEEDEDEDDDGADDDEGDDDGADDDEGDDDEDDDDIDEEDEDEEDEDDDGDDDVVVDEDDNNNDDEIKLAEGDSIENQLDPAVAVVAATDAESGEQDADAEAAAKPKAKRKRKSAKEAAPQKTVTIIHLVFDEPGGAQIERSFELEPAYKGEIIYIEDNYSLGPVTALAQPEGWQARKSWWQSVLSLPEDEQPEVMTSDKMKLHQLLQSLEEGEDEHAETVLWIWMGQNERDVAGYYYIISHLMAMQGRIQVLYLNNLPFIDEKGHIFYPRQLAEILPKEFVKASRLARVVTLSEFELDPEEWDKLSRQPGSVRLLEGGKKLVVKEDEHYDRIILDQLGASTMKLSKLLTLLTSKAKLGLPEYYILWRVKSLIETGQVVSQGEFEKGAKNVTMKATQGQLFVELNQDEAEDIEGE